MATVLLVEDDPGDQALTKRAFENGKVQVDLRIVPDGQQALDYVFRRGAYESAPRPDLILLDLNLPGLDGKQVLERLREDPTARRIPVVALTTSAQEADIRRTYELGANSYIVKPLDMQQFVATLTALGSYWFQVVVLPTDA